MTDDLRQHQRIRAERLKVLVPDRAALENHLRDISQGGLYLKSSSMPPMGQVLGVELFPPGAAAGLPLSGTVVRVESGGFALKLDPLPEATLEQLTALLTSLAATEPGAPAPRSLEEAKFRIAALQAELAAARGHLDRLQQEVVGNRLFLARALGGATPAEKTGPGLGHALFLIAGVFGGLVAATLLMVLRRPEGVDPPPRRFDSTVVLGVTFDAGRSLAQVRLAARDAGAALALESPAPTGGRPARAVEPAVPPADDSGHLNLTVRGAADVWLDGKRLGRAPQRAVSVKPGRHQVRFDCDSDAGPRVGQPQPVEALPFVDTDLDFDCQ